MSIIDKLRRKQAERVQTDAETYRDLLSKEAGGADLTPAEQGRLEKAADGLGKTVEAIEADLSALAEIRAVAGAEATLSKLAAAAVAARAARAEHDRETERLRAEHADAMRARDAARPGTFDAEQAYEQATAAAGRHRMLSYRHARLLCVPNPTRPATAYVDADGVVGWTPIAAFTPSKICRSDSVMKSRSCIAPRGVTCP